MQSPAEVEQTLQRLKNVYVATKDYVNTSQILRQIEILERTLQEPVRQRCLGDIPKECWQEFIDMIMENEYKRGVSIIKWENHYNYSPFFRHYKQNENDSLYSIKILAKLPTGVSGMLADYFITINETNLDIFFTFDKENNSKPFIIKNQNKTYTWLINKLTE